MTPLRIRYAPWLPVVGLVVGVLLAVLAISTQEYLSLALGTLLVGLGVLLLKNPALVVEHNQVRVLNLLGATRKTYPFSNPRELEIKDHTLVHQPGDVRISPLGISANKADVASLEALIGR